MNKQSFIADIRTFMEQNGISVYRLAKLCGVEPRSLWGFVNKSDECGLSLTNFFKVWAVIYGCDKTPAVRTLKTQFVI